MTSRIAQIADGISPAMSEALQRLLAAKVWIDGRSRKALVRRGLAREHSQMSDALIGDFVLTTVTPLGREVRNYLQGKQDG